MTCQRGWGPPHGAGATLGAPVPSRGLGWPPPTHRRAQSLFPRLKPSLLKSSAPRGAGANPPPGEKRGTGVRGGAGPCMATSPGGDTEGTQIPPTSQHASTHRDTRRRSWGYPGGEAPAPSSGPGRSEPSLCPLCPGGTGSAPQHWGIQHLGETQAQPETPVPSAGSQGWDVGSGDRWGPPCWGSGDKMWGGEPHAQG